MAFSRFDTTHPVILEVEQNWDVYTDIVELRALANADRAYVLGFHNGTEFLPSRPVWKLSCTHEVVRPGVSYQAARLQGILVSLIPEIISAVLAGSSHHTGIMTPECTECNHKILCRKNNKRVVVFQVEDMDDSFSKHHFEEKNIKTTILGGITKNGSVNAMVGIDYCGTRLSDDLVKKMIAIVCHSTDVVQYHLQSKKDQAGTNSPERPIPSYPV